MAKKINGQKIEEKAIELIPKEMNKLLNNVRSARTRTLLQLREFSALNNRISTREVLRASLLRFFSAEIIRKAGIKKFGKTPVYNKVKLKVRAEIAKYLTQNPGMKIKFEKAVDARQKGLFSKSRSTVRRIIKRIKPLQGR